MTKPFRIVIPLYSISNQISMKVLFANFITDIIGDTRDDTSPLNCNIPKSKCRLIFFY